MTLRVNFRMSGLEFYTAEEFNEKFLKPSDEPWYRLTNESETHNDFVYKTGVNTNTEEFDPEQEYGGGLYFASKSQIRYWFSYHNKFNRYKRRVLSICAGSSVTVDSADNQAKTHSYVLGEREEILEGMTQEEIDSILINEKGSHATFYYCMLPMSMRTDRIRDLFVDHHFNGLYQLEKEHRTFARCCRAIKKYGDIATQQYPKDYPEIGNAGILDQSEVIPDHFWGQELFEVSIKLETKYPKTFILDLFLAVPVRYRTQRVINLAVRKSHRVLDQLEPEHFTKELCIHAITHHPNSFSSLKLDLLSFDQASSVAFQAVSLGCPLSLINSKYRSTKLYIEAIRKSKGKVLEQIPDTILTDEFLVAMLAIQPSALLMIPEVRWTSALIKSALDNLTDRRLRAKIEWMSRSVTAESA